MTNSELVSIINDTVLGLHSKINVIANIPDGSDERIIAVKRKTIEVLNNALNKISSANRSDLDFSEVQRGLETINVKSNELYENAIRKIDELRRNVSAGFTLPRENSSVQIENASLGIHDMNAMPMDEISRQAIEILKDWLIPEGDER